MRAAALKTYRHLLEAAWVREVPVGAADETLARVGQLLRGARIRFAVAGGFAVIEHGYERFTKDIDLLVHSSDLQRAIEALRAADFTGGRTPLGAELRDPETSVEIDLIGTAFAGDERALVRARRARQSLPVISAPHLILMKLETGRTKDYADVVELLKCGVSASSVARHLAGAAAPVSHARRASTRRAPRSAAPRSGAFRPVPPTVSRGTRALRAETGRHCRRRRPRRGGGHAGCARRRGGRGAAYP